MNATTATDFITTNKGETIAITLTDGTEVYGVAFSVNSKGVNIKTDDGKTRSIAISRIDSLELDAEDDTYGADDTADDEAAADFPEELHDGMTTRELADALDTDPKSLRVVLRSLGMGVGKGRKYSLSVGAYALVKTTIAAS